MPSQEITDLAYRVFKNRIKGYYVPSNKKTKLFTEFKSTLTNYKYRNIKKRMLQIVNYECVSIVCSKYKKQGKPMKQGVKEKVYLRMLSRIVENLNPVVNINICIDQLGSKSFTSTVINKLCLYSNVVSVCVKDSRLEHGIQFVDNICSAIRLNLINTNCEFFNIIKDKVIFIDWI